jgi:predicted dehydrogenase
MMKVVVVGMVHDHCWGEMEKTVKTPGMKLVAAADRNLPLRREAERRHPGIRTYADWRLMVRMESPNIAIIMETNATTHPVVEELAKRGIHMISEKPMSARLWQADRMLKAAKKHGVRLLINWPTAWNPALHEARRLIEKGAIGQVFMAKARGGHKGPKEIGCSPYFWRWLYDAKLNGAGSLADYAGYGANMFRFVLGRQPVSVSAMARRLTKRYRVPDDNSVVTLEYPKALGVIETTWSTVASPPYPSPVFFGTSGTLGVVWGEIHIWRPGKDMEIVKPRPLPKGMRSAPEYMAYAIRCKKPITGPCDPGVSRDAQEVIEGAILSSASGKRIRLPL